MSKKICYWIQYEGANKRYKKKKPKKKTKGFHRNLRRGKNAKYV